MPNRVIREGILTSERINLIAVDPGTEVFYRRLHSVVDDYGRYAAHPSLLRAALYPLMIDDVTDAQIATRLKACEQAELVRIYVANGKQYLEVLDFRQQLRAKSSKWPVPEWHTPSTRAADAQHLPSTCAAYAQHLLSASETGGLAHAGPESNRIESESNRNELPPELLAAFQACRAMHDPGDGDFALQTLLGKYGRGEVIANDAPQMVPGMRRWTRSAAWVDAEPRFMAKGPGKDFYHSLAAWIRERAWLSNPAPCAEDAASQESERREYATAPKGWKGPPGYDDKAEEAA